MRGMRPAHPFLTEQLDHQRANHRRWLASVPKGVLSGAACGGVDWPSDGDERAALETAARRLAQQEYDNDTELRSMVNAFGELHDAEADLELLKRTNSAVRQGAADGVFAPLRSKASTASDAAYIEQDRIRQCAGLWRLIPLMVWADELADDDYCDARLGRGGTAATA